MFPKFTAQYLKVIFPQHNLLLVVQFNENKPLKNPKDWCKKKENKSIRDRETQQNRKRNT